MNTSDVIQLASLPMELIGLYLTVIDTFFEANRRKLEKQFDGVIQRTDELWNRYNKYTLIPFFLIIISFAVSIVLVGMSPKSEVYRFYMDTQGFLFAGAVLVITIFNLLSRVFLPQRKLLALGISLSFVGVLGEIYQVTQIEFKF